MTRRTPATTLPTQGIHGYTHCHILTVDEIRDSLAVREVRSANWAEFRLNSPRATFSGRLVEPGPIVKVHSTASIQLSGRCISRLFTRDLTPPIIGALRKHQILWMTGYAVFYYLLAKFILLRKVTGSLLKAVVTSEKVTPEMCSVMEKAYQCQVFEEYSTVENALFASECEHGRLHISPDVGIVEILRPDCSPCDPGETGEVVTTCLMRTLQPMIRFYLGDLAAWDPEPCPCGRSMPVIKEVVGRIEDIVICPDGRQLVRFHGIFVNQPNVIEGQIIQESLDHIHVKVVPTDSYTDSDTQDIIHRVQQRLSSSVKVTVECVPSIPRTKAGKFKAVISKVR